MMATKPKWLGTVLTVLFLTAGAAFIVFSCIWYYQERRKPGGDRVREAWLERKRCERTAHNCYEKCRKEPRR